MASCYRRLPLSGLSNARDLGGYPTKDGGLTKFRVFIRSEVPRNLTETDLAFIKEYGVRTSIDFRGDREVDKQPSFLKDVGWVNYLRSPVFNKQPAFKTRKTDGETPVTYTVSWRSKYIEMAENCKAWVRETLTYFAESEGTVIFNCTTGKDRTGMIAALLLGLSDVSDQDIIADYCVSEVFLAPVYRELLSAFPEQFPPEDVCLADPFFKTEPENMSALLNHYHDEYGGIHGYLKSCLVSKGHLDKIRSKFVN